MDASYMICVLVEQFKVSVVKNMKIMAQSSSQSSRENCLVGDISTAAVSTQGLMI
jgi:hypothetical protein